MQILESDWEYNSYLNRNIALTAFEKHMMWIAINTVHYRDRGFDPEYIVPPYVLIPNIILIVPKKSPPCPLFSWKTLCVTGKINHLRQ